MDDTVLQHVMQRLRFAKIENDPFPYFHIEQIFPEDFYQSLLENLPEDSSFVSLANTGKVDPRTYKERLVLPLRQPELHQLPFSNFLFWSRFKEALQSEPWISLLLEKFDIGIRQRFGAQYDNVKFSSTAELVRDRTNYSIGPHTDHPIRVVTLLFYFPASLEYAGLGTSLYRPLDPTFSCEGFSHHPFDRFMKISTAPFLPNSVFGFLKNDHSFHGVEPIRAENIERNLMNYYLQWNHK